MHDVLRVDLDNILGRKAEIWSYLCNRSLFMTGGTGWFGRWLLEAIRHANTQLGTNIQVTVLSRNPTSLIKTAPYFASDPAIQFHIGDVRDFTFPKGAFTHIIHAATTSARETYEGATSLSKFDTLVTGTRRVLDFATYCGAQHLLFTSSGAAYGLVAGNIPLCEDNTSAPDTMLSDSGLGQAKRAAEFLCADAALRQGWHLTVARCFSFVGPFMPLDIHYAIGNFLSNALLKKPIIVTGNGSPIRSYLYIADLISWLLTLLTRHGPPRIFNVGSDVPISIGDLALLVRDTINPSGEVRFLNGANSCAGNPVRNSYYPSIRRARNELSLDIWTDLPIAIMRTATHSIAS